MTWWLASDFHAEDVPVDFMSLIFLVANAEAGLGVLFTVFVAAIVFALANLADVALAIVLQADIQARITVTSRILTVYVHWRCTVQGFPKHGATQASVCSIVASTSWDVANVAVAAGTTEWVLRPSLSLKVIVTVWGILLIWIFVDDLRNVKSLILVIYILNAFNFTGRRLFRCKHIARLWLVQALTLGLLQFKDGLRRIIAQLLDSDLLLTVTHQFLLQYNELFLGICKLMTTIPFLLVTGYCTADLNLAGGWVCGHVRYVVDCRRLICVLFILWCRSCSFQINRGVTILHGTFRNRRLTSMADTYNI